MRGRAIPAHLYHAQFSDGRSTTSFTAVECLRHALAIFYYSHLAATGLPRPWALLTASCCEYVATVLLTMLVLMLAKVTPRNSDRAIRRAILQSAQSF